MANRRYFGKRDPRLEDPGAIGKTPRVGSPDLGYLTLRVFMNNVCSVAKADGTPKSRNGRTTPPGPLKPLPFLKQETKLGSPAKKSVGGRNGAACGENLGIGPYETYMIV